MRQSSIQWVRNQGFKYAGVIPAHKPKGKKTHAECCYHDLEGTTYPGTDVSVGDRFYGESPDELACYQCLSESRVSGRVLVVGMGTGVSARVLGDNPNVTDIVILEPSATLATLVGAHVPEKCTVVVGSLKTTPIPEKFSWAFIDPGLVMSANELKPELVICSYLANKTLTIYDEAVKVQSI